MSVTICFRKSCTNIVEFKGGRYSPVFGFICDECFDELKTFNIGTDVKSIVNFMAVPKVEVNYNTLDDYNKIFPKCNF